MEGVEVSASERHIYRKRERERERERERDRERERERTLSFPRVCHPAAR